MSVEDHSFTEEDEVPCDRVMQTSESGSSTGDVPTFLQQTAYRYLDVEAGQSPPATRQAAGCAAMPGVFRQNEMGVTRRGGGGHPYVGLPAAWGLRILNPSCADQVGRMVTLRLFVLNAILLS